MAALRYMAEKLPIPFETQDSQLIAEKWQQKCTLPLTDVFVNVFVSKYSYILTRIVCNKICYFFAVWIWLNQCWYWMKYLSRILLFFLVQTNKSKFCWIIVQNDKIRFHLPILHTNLFKFNEWKYRKTVCIG